jgi:heme-degrading monooxygenase HmoA
MYARLSTYPLRPGTRAAVEEGLEHWIRLLAAQPGHRRTTFYFTAAEDRFGSVSLWDSREQAEAVTGALGAATMQSMGAVMTGPPTTEIVEVVHDAGSEHPG